MWHWHMMLTFLHGTWQAIWELRHVHDHKNSRCNAKRSRVPCHNQGERNCSKLSSAWAIHKSLTQKETAQPLLRQIQDLLAAPGCPVKRCSIESSGSNSNKAKKGNNEIKEGWWDIQLRWHHRGSSTPHYPSRWLLPRPHSIRRAYSCVEHFRKRQQQPMPSTK